MSRRSQRLADRQESYELLQGKASTWLTEIQQDIHPNTGYLVQTPSTLYGKKVKETVHYICSQSPHYKAILHSRAMRPSACIKYCYEVFKFLADYVLPVMVAFTISYIYYTSYDTPIILSAPVSLNQTMPTPVNRRPADLFDWSTLSNNLPTPEEAGTWVGTTLRQAAAVPITFVATAIDRGLHVTETATYVADKGSQLFWTPVLFLTLYFSTIVVLRFLLNLRALASVESALWNYQQILLTETEQAIERAITSIMRPACTKQFESLLLESSHDDDVSGNQLALPNRIVFERIHATYQTNFDLLPVVLFDRITNNIKRIPVPRLLAMGNLSPEYMKCIHKLIRLADEELSTTMLEFNEELARVPNRIKGGATYMAGKATDGLNFAMRAAMI